MNNRHNHPRFWNVLANKGAGTGVITLEGEICDVAPSDLCGNVANGLYYTNEDFRKDLEQCESLREVTVNINSVGGDLYQGLAIHNALKSLPCKVTTVVQGIAASAASIIFCAGDERLVYPGSILMVHGVQSWVDFCDYVNDFDVSVLITRLKALKKSIGTMNEALADIYAKTTGKKKEECLSLIANDAEKYMSGGDAIAEGFATGMAKDGYQPDLRMVACAGKRSLFSNNILLSDDFHAPENAADLGIVESEEIPQPSMDKETEPTENAEVQEQPAPATTVQTPSPNQDDVKAAIAADRKRIAEIDNIAVKFGNLVSAELVKRAKFGTEEQEPMNAEQFALAIVNNIDPSVISGSQRETELAPANKIAAGSFTATADPNGVLRDKNGVRVDISQMIERSSN